MAGIHDIDTDDGPVSVRTAAPTDLPRLSMLNHAPSLNLGAGMARALLATAIREGRVHVVEGPSGFVGWTMAQVPQSTMAGVEAAVEICLPVAAARGPLWAEVAVRVAEVMVDEGCEMVVALHAEPEAAAAMEAMGFSRMPGGDGSWQVDAGSLAARHAPAGPSPA